MSRYGALVLTKSRTVLIRLIATLAILAAAAAGCSGGEKSADNNAGSIEDTTTTTPDGKADVVRPAEGSLPVPQIGTLPVGKGKVVLLPPTIDLAAAGYVEEERSITGTAKRYRATGSLADGEWATEAVDPEAFTTRVMIRRPQDPAKFDGTVVVEWFNVSGGLEAAPDWTYLHRELIRSGAAWVGVSAQKLGIEGGSGGLVAGLTLKASDPDRYGGLRHPGDDYSYDMFTQVASAIWSRPDEMLGGLTPKRVIATGESQSAFRMTTYVNAVAPQANAFSGYLIHSRGKSGAPLIVSEPDQQPPDGTKIREDVGAPVLTFLAETDLAPAGLGAVAARQPDSETHRTWEVAGTAHGDAYLLGIGDKDVGDGEADLAGFAELQAPRSSVYFGVISCEKPINAGPHGYVLRSAFRALVEWVDSGEPPAKRPPLDYDDSTGDFHRDEHGNATGGIRTPMLDAPIATLSGLGQSGGTFCALFGTTTPFGPETLSAKYGDLGGYRTAWLAAVDTAEQAGSILAVEAEKLRDIATRFRVTGLS